ncbi:hypothetical protein ACFONC_14330 [Luteimonas soli]|uniref:Uncharacterized protein n=1 Tax=Luteimonas soli TaxID=1648966 RepID=A0ABV7XQE8_9GAMM
MTRCNRLSLIFVLACTAACTAPDRAGDPAGAAPAAGAGEPVDATAPASGEGDVLAGEGFRAQGNEPFWAIDVEGDVLHFVTPEMPEGRTLQGVRIAHAKGVAFSGEDDGRPFNLDITRVGCSDSMSGQEFEFTATWDYAGQRMHGCARTSE